MVQPKFTGKLLPDIEDYRFQAIVTSFPVAAIEPGPALRLSFLDGDGKLDKRKLLAHRMTGSRAEPS